MTDSGMTDERLMAYADDALSPDEAAAVEEAIARDADLAKRVEMYRETAKALGALAEASRPAAPDPLAARIREMAGKGAPRRGGAAAPPIRRAPRIGPFGRMALAAGISLIAGIAGTYALMRDAPGAGGALFAGLEPPAAIEALETLPSGERRKTGAGVLTAVSTFDAAGGALCREIEYAPQAGRVVVSVICRDEGGWRARFALAAGPAREGGYAPASSLAPLDAFLIELEAGPPLSREAEAAALRGARAP